MRFLVSAAVLAVFWGASCAAPTVPGGSDPQPKALGLYYGWPSAVNGATTIDQAVASFSKFSLVVLGDGLEVPTHGDHTATGSIIAALTARGRDVFGYVDLGVSSPTQNLSEADWKLKVDQWKALGVTGIFWDDAGFDYGVTRERQTAAVDYCHAQGLKVVMNAWVPDDVGWEGNSLQSGDVYLFESFLVSGGTYLDRAAWKTKADRCAALARSQGWRIACLSTFASGTVLTPSDASDPRFVEARDAAASYGFDFFQLTDLGYSSATNSLVRL